MNFLTINIFYLFISLIFFFVINNKYIYIKCLSNLLNNYYNELEYNKTHCFKNKFNIFFSNNFKNYEYCNRNLKKKKKSSKRKKKKAKQILKGLKIVSLEETIDEIINKNRSISRFGDGEFRLMFGISISFQKKNKLLSKRLKNVLKSNEEGLLIGIPNSLNFEYLNKFKNRAKKFWSNFIKKYKFKMNQLNKNKIYYSSFISRFYFDYKDTSGVSKYIKKLKKIWEKKDILIIEGEKSRLGIGNDLFNDTNSIARIICPSINAFNLYDKIFKEILKVNKKKLILLAIGPTATILAYDLYKAGYHVIDIGHVDIEYEWYLRNATTKIKIEGKFVNEAKNGKTKIKDIYDKNYLNQIIAKVLK